MKTLALLLAAVALTACADSAARHVTAPPKAARNVIVTQCNRSGYMVAYNNGVATDSTYTGCTQ